MSDGTLSTRQVAAPVDPIFGIVDAYRADQRPHKMNLAAGVYMDETGLTPIPASIREAERRILAASTSKLYAPISGEGAYLDAVRNLLFRQPGDAWGATHPAVADGRVTLLHTPGGTGAMRLAVDLVARLRPGAEVWVGEPTWPNHFQIVDAARVNLCRFAWLTTNQQAFDESGLHAALDAAKAGDAFIFHGTCHNPTGIDPTATQWQQIAERVEQRGLIPIIDTAYQGLGDGLIADTASLRAFLATGVELLVASSASKNFSLYNERVGALAIVGATGAATSILASHARQIVRTMWSNPPVHGGAIVATILGDMQLRTQWEEELEAMRLRILASRHELTAALAAAGAQGFARLLEGRGMFSLLGLTDTQLARLRGEHAIYLVAQGRINMAGLSPAKVPVVAQAVAQVLAGGDR
jgi:aspartate aminotransferase